MGFVRAKGPDGAEFTIEEAAARRMGATVLNKPAVDRNGRPLVAKPATKLDGKPKASASTDKPKEG